MRSLAWTPAPWAASTIDVLTVLLMASLIAAAWSLVWHNVNLRREAAKFYYEHTKVRAEQEERGRRLDEEHERARVFWEEQRERLVSDQEAFDKKHGEVEAALRAGPRRTSGRIT